VAPSPVLLPDGGLLVTAGYGAGSRMFRIEEREGEWSVRPVHTWPRTHFACEQQTPVRFEGDLFTIMPNDAGALNRQLVRMRPDGTHVWTSGKTHRFGLGPFMVADGKIFVLDDDGTLTMADARADAFTALASAKVLDGREAWGPPALVDGLMLCRDSKRLVCLDLRAVRDTPPAHDSLGTGNTEHKE
jgi:outer membrane protein assembly factor BamB